MARIVYNPGIETISGGVGGFVYRQHKDGALTVAKRPLSDPDRIPTEAQAQHQQLFKEASARYERLMEDASIRQAYEQIRTGRGPTSRLRALVMGEIMKAPEIRTVDLSHYTGAVGDQIRIVAGDSVGVLRLTLTVHDTTSGEDLETAEKLLADKITGTVEWLYTATAALPDESLHHIVDIVVKAYDLAGNETVSLINARANA